GRGGWWGGARTRRGRGRRGWAWATARTRSWAAGRSRGDPRPEARGVHREVELAARATARRARLGDGARGRVEGDADRIGCRTVSRAARLVRPPAARARDRHLHGALRAPNGRRAPPR